MKVWRYGELSSSRNGHGLGVDEVISMEVRFVCVRKNKMVIRVGSPTGKMNWISRCPLWNDNVGRGCLIVSARM